MLTKNNSVKDFIKKRFHKYETIDDVLKNHKTLDDLVGDDHDKLDKIYDEKYKTKDNKGSL